MDALTRNPVNQLKEAAARAIRNDSRSAWTISERKLSDLHEIFNKSSKPSDWDIKYASLNQATDQIIRDTYKWVNNNLNPQKPIHQLALLVAVIIAKLAPQICWPNDLVPRENIRSVIREAPWVEGHDGRKGGKELKPFITMVSTHMIAILEKDSPLQQAANADPNKPRGFGNAWTSKHGSSFFFVIVLNLSDPPFV
jgi:hypothetical protein